MALVSATVIEELRAAAKTYRETGSFPDGFVRKPEENTADDDEVSLPKE